MKLYINCPAECLTHDRCSVRHNSCFSSILPWSIKYLSSALEWLCNILTWLGWTSFSKNPLYFLVKEVHKRDSCGRSRRRKWTAVIFMAQTYICADTLAPLSVMQRLGFQLLHLPLNLPIALLTCGPVAYF